MKRNIEEVIKKLNVGIDVDGLEAEIEKVKDDIKKLLKLRMVGDVDLEIYHEENNGLDAELNSLRMKREAVTCDEERKIEMRGRTND